MRRTNSRSKSKARSRKVGGQQGGKVFVVRDPIFCADHLVCCGTTFLWAFERLRTLIEKAGHPFEAQYDPIRTSTIARTVCCGFKGTLIWFKDKRPGGGILAHEAFHATYNVLGISGVALSDQSEETYAYYLDWLVRQIGNKVW